MKSNITIITKWLRTKKRQKESTRRPAKQSRPWKLAGSENIESSVGDGNMLGSLTTRQPLWWSKQGIHHERPKKLIKKFNEVSVRHLKGGNLNWRQRLIPQEKFPNTL